MADGAKNIAKPESPTTARPLDFDDEPLETGVISASRSSNNETPPQKPPRPLSPQQEAENTLKEAFPSIDASVVKAVVVASGGNVDRAFHALLGMSDPDAQIEPPPPPKPPRPTMATSTTQSQLEQDEMYARQLEEHYNSSERHRGQPGSAWDNEPHLPRRHTETGLKPNELYDDRERSFIDDDLPVIKENIRKGFLETQTRVNTWMQTLKKKLEGDEDEDEYYRQQSQQNQQRLQRPGEPQTPGLRRSGEARRSADRERYDADPRVLSDDFATLELRDSDGKLKPVPLLLGMLTGSRSAPQNRPPRPTANPDLFKAKSPSPDRRKVSFQEGPPEEITDSHPPRTSSHRTPQSGSKASKWQPLATVDPSPVADHDPFSLGDSEDEKDAKKQDLKPEETAQVKKATAEAMGSSIAPNGDTSKKDKAPGGS
ncbi:ubiquitin-binding protein cue5 [Ophidiomyces ophidiicola]|nr:ubiquitin-binding protein cue5 [Ophidiomyces ophidiicola]KAI2146090.1 ubiquitin-binding protein cue5 [Ophidiomyces ophidiicola]KAI2224239.1 ubiquitin-binding protein cue5 [Ophidiomyces ophidiicola]